MLREVRSTRQIPGEPFRRWYTDEDTDLIAWLEKSRIVGFQLAVPGGTKPNVVTWHEGHGLSVSSLDDGEGRPGRPKGTPVLVAGNAIDSAGVLRHFGTVSAELPGELAELVEQKLGELRPCAPTTA